LASLSFPVFLLAILIEAPNTLGFFLFFFFVVLGFELGLYLEPLHQPYFVMGSGELFAQAGFKPRSS
jgi:hypothetical protein